MRPEDLQGRTARSSCPFNLNSAARTLACEHEIDRSSELVRNQIAYEIGAIARSGPGCHRGTAGLAPLQDQGCGGSVRLAIPIDRYLAAGDRQRSIFYGVRRQLV